MITFEVDDMTCGHCVSTITKAVKAEDTDAKVQVDLSTHRVVIESSSASAEDLRDAIAEVGYTPMVVDPTVGTVTAVARKGCCCNSPARLQQAVARSERRKRSVPTMQDYCNP